jgi:hypothetical protein
MPDMTQDPISRRKMLKRIGVGAAVAWSAPVLMSIRTPAFGQASPVCAPSDCPECDFGEQCGPNCQCAGVPPPDCFCSDGGACNTDFSICETDADCVPYTGPGSRCAPCVPFEECMESSCWSPCGDGQGRIPRGRGIRVLRPSK